MASKQISQETFDAAVRENIQEFDMSVEEAIEDAVAQFQSQGANLNSIIKGAHLYSADGGETTVHPVVDALQSLVVVLDSEAIDSEIIVKHLITIQTECDVDLPHRCLAGKNQAYNTLLKTLKKYQDNIEVTKQTLVSLCSLCNGQPDLLDSEGLDFMLQLLRCNKDNEEVRLTIKLLSLNCIKHEGNRQALVDKGFINTLVGIVNDFRQNAGIIKEVCFALRVLTFDDDIRVPFGQSHEHAKMIVTEGDALKTLLQICQEWTQDVEVQGEVFATLSKLVVRDEFCKEVKDLGGLDLILKSFQQNFVDKAITKQALLVLKALAGNDDIKIAIVASGGVDLILSAVNQHQGSAVIAEAGCALLTTLALRNPGNCEKIVSCNGHHVILQAMKIHTNKEAVQKAGCMAIRNLVSRSRQFCELVLELGAEALINHARKFKSCNDEARAALRDLGCNVQLKELWTGEKGSLEQ